MTQSQVIHHMKKALDWNAREYDKCSEQAEKERIAHEFKIETQAFNTALTTMFKRIKSSELFISKIETYIIVRKCENWE